MAVVAQIFAGLVLLIHVYIVLIETVLFKTRGRKVFGISAEKSAEVAPAMLNQGFYNGFLVVALLLGFVLPNAAVAQAFTVYGLACVAVAGVVGALSVSKRIFFVQTVPALIGLIALFLA